MSTRTNWLLIVTILWVYSVDVSAAKDCVVFSLDADGNSSLDKYIADNPDAEQVPVRDVLDESTLRAFGNYNQDSQWVALCSAPVKAYHPKARHCVDRKPYESNEVSGKWVCQYDEKLSVTWRNGEWDQDGNWIKYPQPCPSGEGVIIHPYNEWPETKRNECPTANVLDQSTIDILAQ